MTEPKWTIDGGAPRALAGCYHFGMPSSAVCIVRAAVPIVALGVVVACGGSDDTQPAPSTQAMITDLCQSMAALPCASPQEEQDCLAQSQVDQNDAAQEGCEAALDRYLRCATSRPLYCGGNMEQYPHPVIADECGELRVAFGECYSGISGNCAVGVGAGNETCSLLCPDFSARCQGPDPNGPVDCACDTGPKTGTTFSATDCSKNLAWATGHHCK